jgi:hypothetical protein
MIRIDRDSGTGATTGAFVDLVIHGNCASSLLRGTFRFPLDFPASGA